MRLPEQACERLRVIWRRHANEWLGGGGTWPLGIPLGAPGEHEAMQAWETFQSWRRAWKAWSGPGEILWTERRWPGLGRQEIPGKWRLPDATAAAAALGESARWRTAEQRFRMATGCWPVLASCLRARLAWLADTDDGEWGRVCAMFAWLLDHPASGLFARQLPVAGLDSKWLETHTGLLAEWLGHAGGGDPTRDFWQASGLRREPDRLRVRVLDPALCARVGGLCDIHAPLEEWAGLQLPVRHVFIVENKQTGLAFDDLPGSVVLMARGYAVDRLSSLPWVVSAGSVHYWGDIDTHGLAILGRLRGHLPRVTSLLMDEATLLAHRDLWVAEPQPHGAETVDHLTPSEQALYRDLRGDRFGVRVRLEQERIGWDHAWPRLRQVAEAQ